MEIRDLGMYCSKFSLRIKIEQGNHKQDSFAYGVVVLFIIYIISEVDLQLICSQLDCISIFGNLGCESTRFAVIPETSLSQQRVLP